MKIINLEFKNLVWLFKITVFTVLIGRAYQFLFFDAPLRAFLWDASLLQPFVENVLNLSWNEYVTDLTIGKWINNVTKSFGVLFIIAAVTSLMMDSKKSKWFKTPVFIAAIVLFLIALLETKDHFYHVAQFFEYSIQIGILIMFVFSNVFTASKLNARNIFIFKVIIAITFVAHGLYAIGFYPIPGNFIDMTIISTSMNQNQSELFLKIVGILDILIAIVIFIPKASRYALIYAFIWGLLTAFARITSQFDINFPLSTLHQSSYLVVYRLSHGLLPLFILLHYINSQKISLNKL